MSSLLELRNQFPVRKFTKSYEKTLSGKSKGVLMFEHFRNDLDILEVYHLEAEDHNCFNEIKSNFAYDYSIGDIKKEYKDSFGRLAKVIKIK